MAITKYDYLFWKELRDEGSIPPEPVVLELGQANWFGDLDPACLVEDVKKYANPDLVEVLLDQLALPETPEVPKPFIQADVFYFAILNRESIESIDLNGTPRADRWDLNKPTDRRQEFDIVINSGTAEHIFNQDQFFRTCHDSCRSGGVMAHMLPARGWLDHGLYNYHPTFIADLAATNGYDIVKWWLYDLPADLHKVITNPKDVHDYAKEFGMAGSTMHAVCFRKTADTPFQMPMQGFYADTLSPELKRAWRAERDW